MLAIYISLHSPAVQATMQRSVVLATALGPNRTTSLPSFDLETDVIDALSCQTLRRPGLQVPATRPNSTSFMFLTRTGADHRPAPVCKPFQVLPAAPCLVRHCKLQERAALVVNENGSKVLLRLADDLGVRGNLLIIRCKCSVPDIVGIRGQSKTARHAFPARNSPLELFKNDLPRVAAQEIDQELGCIRMRDLRRPQLPAPAT